MTISTIRIQVSTKGFDDVHNLTDNVEHSVTNSQIENGIVTVFVPGSTAGITTIEYESGAITDLKNAIERLVPQELHYNHDTRWGDGNGFSHIRSALMGPSITVPVTDGRLQLGTWQQIILIDFDNRPRQRDVIVQIVGE